MRAYQLYLKDILQATEDIENFVQGMTFEAFQADRKTVSAVIHQFGILGEAAKQIPVHIHQAYPDVPWKEMARMRDRLIHGYYRINYQRVWRTIHEDLPQLRVQVQYVLEQEAKRGPGNESPG